MIANALIFTFGFFAALLLALLLVPLIWRRATRVSLRRYEAEIPASLNEIRASFDHRLAAEAFRTREREIAAQTLSERAQRERLEAGRLAHETGEMRERTRDLFATIDSKQSQIEDIQDQLAEREREIQSLSTALGDVQQEIEERLDDLENLEQRYRDLGNRCDEQDEAIADLEARLRELSDDDEAAETGRRRSSSRADTERDPRIDRLKREVESLEEQVERERAQRLRINETTHRLEAIVTGRQAPSDRSKGRDAAPDFTDENGRSSARVVSLAERLGMTEDPLARARELEGDDLRAYVEDFAARVIHEIELQEGGDGPVARMLDEAEADRSRQPAGQGGSETLDLAERVRRLRQSHQTRGQAAE